MIWLVFGVMLLAGTLVVAWPLLSKTARFGALPASAIVLVVAVTVTLYARIGTPGAADVSAAAAGVAGQQADIDAMVAGLAQRLAENPDDVAGWKMLARSYVQLRRYADAVDAFEEALARGDSNDGQTLADLGEAVLLQARSPVTGRSAQLFEEALAAAPNNPKALFYSGIAALERGDRDTAADRWETLLAQSPPPEIQDILRQRIAEWRGESAAPAAAAPAVAADVPAGAADVPPGATASIDVSLGEAAAGTAPDDATVFIIARDPAQPSPPIAAVRRRVSELPDTVTLSDADAMIPGRELSAFRELEIVARISMSGGPIEQSGDWYGTLRLDTGQTRQGRIVIDRVVE